MLTTISVVDGKLVIDISAHIVKQVQKQFVLSKVGVLEN